MKSMTGYGRGQAESDGTAVTIEISAVNHKQRDFRVNIPPELVCAEALINSRLSATVVRGGLNVAASCHLAPQYRLQQTRLDPVLLRQIVDELRTAARENGLTDAIAVTDLLQVPGLLEQIPGQLPVDLLCRLAAEALEQALCALDATRREEGQALQRDLQGRVDLLNTLAKQIDGRKDEAMGHYQKRLHERIKLLGVEIAFDDERLAKEVAFAAQKSDITEELVRLFSHMAQFLADLASEEPIGRHLQFLCQEMQREINTLTAKTSETDIAGLGLIFKTELDRVREQVCNIE